MSFLPKPCGHKFCNLLKCNVTGKPHKRGPVLPPFKVVVADPAWSFGDRLPGKSRGAAKNYDVMSVEDICRLDLPPIDDNAHLFLWRVSAMQQEALDVVKSWGFTVKSELVWLKKTKTGKDHFGMGRHVRLAHEICLIATRGKGAGIKNRSQRSTFETEVEMTDEELAQFVEVGDGIFEGPTGKHSQKPDEFYKIVEELCDSDLRVELFARQSRPGWVTLGNQVPGNPVTLGTR